MRPIAATKDALRETRRERLLASFCAVLCGAFALGGTSLHVAGIIGGRFEDMRYFGTIVIDDNPIGFVLMALFWAAIVAVLAAACVAFLRQARR